MKELAILFVAIAITALALTSNTPAPKIVAKPAPVIVGSPPGEVAALQAEIQQLKAELAKHPVQVSEPVKVEAKPLPISKPASLPRPKPPVATKVRSQKAATGGGKWVDVPVYGPLGRQRGTRREWQTNQVQRVQYRANCVNGVCR